MSLLNLKRKQLLDDYLLQFNNYASEYLINHNCTTNKDNSYNITIDHLVQWRLLLLILPQCFFDRIIRLSVLLLLYQDSSLVASGKKLQILAKYYTKNEFTVVRKIGVIGKPMQVDFSQLFADLDFINHSMYHIIGAVYASSDAYIQQRALWRCHNTVVSDLQDLWSKFSAAQINHAVFTVARKICPALFKSKLCIAP